MFAKRKARKIQVSQENDEPTAAAPESAPEEPMSDAPPVVSPSTVKFTRRPIKSSSLRKSININDDAGTPTGAPAPEEDDDDARPAVIRPAVSRAGSTKLKKRGSSSRLSFGVADDSDDTPAFTTPNKKNPTAASLTQRATENNALRASSSATRQIPTRSFGAEPDRPAYSREFLEELQSSTPNTPANLDTLSLHDDPNDAMSLDPSELEGAVFVPSADATLSTATSSAHHIPSALEIRAKKERRARLAKEGDAYASDPDDEGYISLRPKKDEPTTRLIAEDEDLGEGYDEFVEDGRLELGRRGEGAARRKQRREMAALIDTAEGASEDGEDSDSDIERKAAYEAAQTRAAMDGLRGAAALGATAEGDDLAGVGRLVIPKMKPLPELGTSLARMRDLVRGVEKLVAAKQGRIEAVERERHEILEREREVQAVLNEAGLKYQAVMGIKSEHPINPEALAAQSPLRNAAAAGPGAGERGLESFGTPIGLGEQNSGDEENGDVRMVEADV
ncbi:unnamed protein product [Discula destructiva]